MIFFALSLLCALTPQPLQAPTRFSAEAGASIDEALVELDGMQYDRVIEQLYHSKGPYSLDDLVRRDKALGIALAMRHRDKEALQVFKHLLAVAPGYDLSYNLPPQVTILFERARLVLDQRQSTRAELQVSRDANFDTPIPVALFCRGNALELVESWELCFRRRGVSQPYSCQRMPNKGDGGRSDFLLPAIAAPVQKKAASGTSEHGLSPQVRSWAVLQVALSGFDAQGNEVYRAADRNFPIEFEIGLHPQAPWYAPPWQNKAWFWVSLAGLGMTTLALTAAILLSPGDTMSLGAEVVP